ncbi:NAD(P)H-hydrate epimerase [Paludisphaera rhizosphaerae]|uniref:NAD(P)H-hydrate epimerase n=1 Tax=Paludisphaera rhizosphaerae TaxID=2711216 RepID=UPI0013EAB289|nr:NAD(P)H-hydrate epimerase [Paludisphaera rhizosphaerae]
MPPRPACRPLSREEVRSLDVLAADEFGLPTLVLMENAGRGAAELLAKLADGATPRVVIACGPGNNGGDGGVVARHLDAWGWPVAVAWLTDPAKLHGDAQVQREIVDRSDIPQTTPGADDLDALLAGADWIVDGLLGTGLTRPVEGPLRTAIEALNRSGRPILALDLPSGLDADSGRPLGVAVRAQATATFAARKLGFDAPGASEYTGGVTVVDIGLPGKLIRRFA